MEDNPATAAVRVCEVESATLEGSKIVVGMRSGAIVKLGLSPEQLRDPAKVDRIIKALTSESNGGWAYMSLCAAKQYLQPKRKRAAD